MTRDQIQMIVSTYLVKEHEDGGIETADIQQCITDTDAECAVERDEVMRALYTALEFGGALNG